MASGNQSDTGGEWRNIVNHSKVLAQTDTLGAGAQTLKSASLQFTMGRCTRICCVGTIVTMITIMLGCQKEKKK